MAMSVMFSAALAAFIAGVFYGQYTAFQFIDSIDLDAVPPDEDPDDDEWLGIE